MDRYLKTEMRENADYEIFSEEMFNFVKTKYGVDKIIKRYYQKGSYMYSTSLETRFKNVPVHVVRNDVIREGKHAPYQFNQFVAISKKMGYGALRKRIADVMQTTCEDLNADKNFCQDRIRLWLCDDKEELDRAIADVPKAAGNEVKEEKEDVEENTGVEGPGQSLAPLIGSSITLEDKNLSECVIVVEIGTPGFAFRFKK